MATERGNKFFWGVLQADHEDVQNNFGNLFEAPALEETRIREAWSKFRVCVQIVMLWAVFLCVFVLAVWGNDVILHCKELWKASSKLGRDGSGLSPLLFCLFSAAVQSRFHSFPLSATERGQIPSWPQTLTPIAWQSWENPNLLASQQSHRAGLAHTHRARWRIVL